MRNNPLKHWAPGIPLPYGYRASSGIFRVFAHGFSHGGGSYRPEGDPQRKSG